MPRGLAAAYLFLVGALPILSIKPSTGMDLAECVTRHQAKVPVH
jgi:hypothetical protein